MKATNSATVLAFLSFGYTFLPATADQLYKGQDPNTPAAGLNLKTPVSLGCFSSAGSLVDQGFYTFQTSGWCQAWCVRNSWNVMALYNGTNCYCGTSPPSSGDGTDSSACQVSICSGFGQDKCGGPSGFDVYDDGFQGTAKSVTGPNLDSSSPAQSSSVSSTPSVVQIASTVFVTQAGATSAQIVYTTQAAQAPSNPPNKAAIAAGVVVGVIVLLAIAGGAFFLMRQRKRKALDDERRRHESMTNFVTRGGEKPTSASSMTDSRLEPSVVFQRRQSDGSIADNQDYSRRILKITNPDDR